MGFRFHRELDDKVDMLIEDMQTKRKKMKSRQIVIGYEQHGSGELSGADEAHIGDPTSVSIDKNSCCWSTRLEIPERSSCPCNDISSCYLILDLN